MTSTKMRVISAILLCIMIGVIIGFLIPIEEPNKYAEETEEYLTEAYLKYRFSETAYEQEDIMREVIETYPNLKLTDIEDGKLRCFYEDCIEVGLNN